MSKKRIFAEESDLRRDLLFHYRNKYYNLFMSRYKWSGNIDYQQIDYIMRRFWSPEGTVAAIKIEGTDDLLAFCPYAPTMYNLYDYPTMVSLVNVKGVPFIPGTPQIVDQDVVIGFIQKNKKGISPIIDHYIQNIVEAEIALRMNIEGSKIPFIAGTTPENEQKMKVLFEKIHDGDAYLYMATEDIKNLQILQGAAFNADNLWNYIQSQETAIREFLGLDNLGFGEKKEHLITSEIAANDDVTEQSSDVFLQCLESFCTGIRDVLGVNVTVELNVPESAVPDDPDKEEREEDEDEEV